ncbi:MAG: NB-ARC domain-containing protein [Chloroflexota bacterium]
MPKPEKKLSDAVQNALKQYHGDSFAQSPLSSLYLYRQAFKNCTSPRQATNQVINDSLDTLTQNHPKDAELLNMRFLDLKQISSVANKLNVAESTAYASQRNAVKRLADTVRSMEAEARAQQMGKLEQRLESPTYGELIGAEQHIDTLMPQIQSVESPWIIAIEGMGGIGKTSLADILMRTMIHQGTYDEIGWVSARQERFNLGGVVSFIENPVLTGEQLLEKLCQQLLPHLSLSIQGDTEQMLQTLRRRLRDVPHLIVVDNLETLKDVESLLPTIETLTEPSKFILTSRESFYGEPNIFHYSIPELNEAYALALIRQEATKRNLPELAASHNEALLPIYKTVGGNPLALRLVVGQTHIHPIGDVLSDLKEARGETVDTFYTFIYRKAWDSLDELCQRIFLGMVLVKPGGDDIEFLSAVSKLEVDDVRLALNRLVTLNLVDARGGLHERRYSIHGLTRTFLQEQVAKWK